MATEHIEGRRFRILGVEKGIWANLDDERHYNGDDHADRLAFEFHDFAVRWGFDPTLMLEHANADYKRRELEPDAWRAAQWSFYEERIQTSADRVPEFQWVKLRGDINDHAFLSFFDYGSCYDANIGALRIEFARDEDAEAFRQEFLSGH